eukprot:NODE_4325_length_1905_cov_5.472441.p1 GENE.NODE_4325_length_1905_cov_5.472441~~NODE_4325_length_1905_cov_5.472441.p1  ORF type:complete len:367 (-),score=49.12 NODE_4325_length_1905_cov_5.472441:294-1394(-)
MKTAGTSSATGPALRAFAVHLEATQPSALAWNLWRKNNITLSLPTRLHAVPIRIVATSSQTGPPPVAFVVHLAATQLSVLAMCLQRSTRWWCLRMPSHPALTTTGVHCAPGGNATICLGDDNRAWQEEQHRTVHVAVVAAGGGRMSDDMITERHMLGGMRQAPGGNTSVCLRGTEDRESDGAAANVAAAIDTANAQQDVNTAGSPAAGAGIQTMTSSARPAPGGNASICLGEDSPMCPAEQAVAATVLTIAAGAGRISDDMITDRPMLGGVRQAPGGKTSVCLRAEGMVKPVGGATTASDRYAPGGDARSCSGVEDDQSDGGENDGARANVAATNQTEDVMKIVKTASSSRLGLSSGGGTSAVVLG